MVAGSSILTKRMELIAGTVAILEADIARSPKLAELLDAEIPSDWPPPDLAEALPRLLSAVMMQPELHRWGMYYWVIGSDGTVPRTLIGSGGLHGMPDFEGRVEVGYGVLPAFHNRGYATEAVRAIIAATLEEKNVALIFANTGADNQPSIRILEKLGFVRAGVGTEPWTIRFEVDRERFLSAASR